MKDTFLHSDLISLFKKIQYILSATWFIRMSIRPCNPCPCHCYS